MARKQRPNLKDYLRTGVVQMGDRDETQDKKTDAAPAETGMAPAPSPAPADAVAALLSEKDKQMWGPILTAGTALQRVPLDFVALREEFRTSDRDRFTYYILPAEGEALRPVRTSVQIREPLRLVLKWDETGVMTLYEQA